MSTDIPRNSVKTNNAVAIIGIDIIEGDLTFTDEDQALLTEYGTLAYEGDYIQNLTAKTIKGFLEQIPG